ncbi:MAG: hypothetical protein EPN38_03190 [Rhodanobacteraceae bacterium]|nr:MAG: hypothetical protein EPN38_03190 [Rhodanobacteraceae bacterium]
MAKLLPLLLLTALLAACSSSTGPAGATGSAAPAPAATNVLAGTPMAAYGHDLNKARNVQNVINQSAARQAARINAATGATSGN